VQTEARRRLFLAPHLDDGAISHGGTLLAAQRAKPCKPYTVIATVFSRVNYTKEGLGDAAIVTPIRQNEERMVMGSIGVGTLFLGFSECPLRGYTISDPLDYPKRIKPELDQGSIPRISARLGELFAGYDEVLAPLAIGETAHVDHRIVHHAAVAAWRACPGIRLVFYEDLPYIGQDIRDLISAFDGLRAVTVPIDIEAKIRLIQGYASQPIAAWEDLIRRAAGDPPVERTWILEAPEVLARLD
jgi:LmbE family N-acetylglucosaminyl deacetylase